ncbi:hypothetical protein FA15DRAFT_678492 [Coprinopsis marcescibilis]|uniref:Glycosyl transferase CAP10 domain-containing protein n=1 Tax=Coprinopsis marcescibilis TaxID=230819 RepID=A0A5C3L6K0_COPMA|nr:hypothetical protein FA15DRAFT_678492 [Coprinopsis marcescibilis]
MEEAETRYRTKLGSQSKTLKAAVTEYKRRYNRSPPLGFDDWWMFAERNEVKLVDEYDGLMEDLAPFWKLSGKELRSRAAQAGELPFVDLVSIRNGSAKAFNLRNGGSVSGRAEGFRAMIRRIAKELPDMDFPINAQTESRVLVPWERQQYPNITVQDSSQGLHAMLGGIFKADWGDEGNMWEAWRRTCHPDTPARRVFSSLRSNFRVQNVNYFESKPLPGDDFNFVARTSSSIDFCQHPPLHYQQGHFFSDWRPIHALYPIFSPAKVKGFLDIRIPSHYYYGNTPRYTYGWDYVNLELNEVDKMEVPWEKKVDKVFWRGASSGGGNHPPGHSPQFHRHRFIRMASDTSGSTNRTITFADPSRRNHFVSASVPISVLNRETTDVAFVKAVAAESYPGGAKALTSQHRFADSVSLGEHWKYKYVLDLDGVGYSGRFMAFLASDSVPIKGTVYSEFYESWIEPWVHFIPLSPSYQEVYNIHAYFSGPTNEAMKRLATSVVDRAMRIRLTETDRRLRRIARAGKQWKKTIGRHVDIETYVYRLCLEWARLTAEDRESMDYL